MVRKAAKKKKVEGNENAIPYLKWPEVF